MSCYVRYYNFFIWVANEFKTGCLKFRSCNVAAFTKEIT